MSSNFFTSASSILDQMTESMSAEQLAEMRRYEILCDFAIALTEYRETHHLSQADLAHRLGVSQAIVSRYESGSYNITLKTICAVCTKLKIDFDFKLSVPSSSADPVDILPENIDLCTLAS